MPSNIGLVVLGALFEALFQGKPNVTGALRDLAKKAGDTTRR